MVDSDSVEKAQCVAGIITNSLLLYCIRRHSRTPLGAYKQLLTIFASYDLFLSALHVIVEPKIIILNNIFAVVSVSFEDQASIHRLRAMSIYASCFAVPFTLMNIHFLFRYWSIQRRHLITLFSRASFIIFLACIPITEVVAWYHLCIFFMNGDGREEAIGELNAEFERKNGKTIGGGWVLMDHWRHGYEDPRYVFTLLLFDIVMLISLILASSLGVFTFMGIRNQMKTSSVKRKFELKLLFAATAQTLVPFVCVYIPYVCCLNSPYLGLPIGPMADLCFSLISFFPVFDAIIVLFLIRDYRRALLTMISRLSTAKTNSIVHLTSPKIMHNVKVDLLR